MKDIEFESAVRAAFSPATSDQVTAKVDRRLATFRQTRRIRRRIGLSFATVGAVCVALIAVPAVRAEAALSGLEHALDGVKNLTMRSFTIDDAGNRYPGGSMTFDHGRWRLDNAGAATLSYYVDGKLYKFDSLLKAFTVEDRPQGPFSYNAKSFKVSDMISAGMGDPLTRQVSTESAQLDGRPVKRISINRLSLPERYVIYADADTELPIRMEVEGKSGDHWRLATEMTFDYSSKALSSDFAPELKRYPVITEVEADERFLGEMTKSSLVEVPLAKHPLIVRKFDVAEDGAVFVVYQSGNRTANSWSGYAFNLESDDGTVYVRPQLMSGEAVAHMPQAGRLEMEALVPLEPVRLPRKYTLKAMRFSNGKLARQILTGTNYPDGHTVFHWQPNGSSQSDTGANWVDVLRPEVPSPTCKIRPEYAERLAFSSFGNDPLSKITEDRARADYYMDAHKWRDAIRWLQAELDAMHDFGQQGFGPYGDDEAKTKLAQAQKELLPAGR